LRWANLFLIGSKNYTSSNHVQWAKKQFLSNFAAPPLLLLDTFNDYLLLGLLDFAQNCFRLVGKAVGDFLLDFLHNLLNSGQFVAFFLAVLQNLFDFWKFFDEILTLLLRFSKS
jgi:hypothetical protein